MRDLGSLREALQAAGAFERREGSSLLELLGLGLGLTGCLVAITHGFWWMVPLAALACTSIAMYGHEGSHRSFSASPTRNAILTHVTFTLFAGLSPSYWRDKHDRRHHGTPNVEGMDPDIKPFPFSSSSGGHASCGPKERWFQRNFQRWLFWPMSLVMCVGMRRSSVLHVWRAPRSRARTIEIALLAAHYLCWVVAPFLVWGIAGLVVYAAIWALVGVLLALIFAPAHMGLPVVVAAEHHWSHQLAATRNLELPRVLSFFFVGLDYQIEHHLFPKIPHANLRRAAAITRAWCAEAGITYMSVPYHVALADSFGFMGQAWRRPAMVVD